MNLEQRIQVVLHQMRFIGEGPVARFPDSLETSKPTRRKPGEKPRPAMKYAHRPHGESRPPSGEESLHDFWNRKLTRALEHGGPALEMAVAEAEIALEMARHRAPDLKADDERSQLIIETEVGVDPYRVAAKYRCTPNHVRTLRARWEPARHPETGVPLPLRGADISKRERALELAQVGWSIRRIALGVEAPKSTVQDWLKPTDRAA